MRACSSVIRFQANIRVRPLCAKKPEARRLYSGRKRWDDLLLRRVLDALVCCCARPGGRGAV